MNFSTICLPLVFPLSPCCCPTPVLVVCLFLLSAMPVTMPSVAGKANSYIQNDMLPCCCSAGFSAVTHLLSCVTYYGLDPLSQVSHLGICIHVLKTWHMLHFFLSCKLLCCGQALGSSDRLQATAALLAAELRRSHNAQNAINTRLIRYAPARQHGPQTFLFEPARQTGDSVAEQHPEWFDSESRVFFAHWIPVTHVSSIASQYICVFIWRFMSACSRLPGKSWLIAPDCVGGEQVCMDISRQSFIGLPCADWFVHVCCRPEMSGPPPFLITLMTQW